MDIQVLIYKDVYYRIDFVTTSFATNSNKLNYRSQDQGVAKNPRVGPCIGSTAPQGVAPSKVSACRTQKDLTLGHSGIPKIYPQIFKFW